MYSPLNVYNSDSHVNQYTCTKHYDKCFIDLSLFRVVILSRQGVRIINVLSRGCHITWRPGYPFDTMIGKSLCILDRQHCLWHEPCFLSVHVDNDSNKLHVLSYRKHFDWPSFPCVRSTIRVVFPFYLIIFPKFSKVRLLTSVYDYSYIFCLSHKVLHQSTFLPDSYQRAVSLVNIWSKESMT